MFLRALPVLLTVVALACQGSRAPQNTEFGDEAPMKRASSPASPERSSPGLQTIYFDFDRSTLGPQAKRTLRDNARFLEENADLPVEIQGHADERGTEEYNLALGSRRAQAARRYLIDLGVDGDKLSAVSYGEEAPMARGHSEAAWAKNRRGAFVSR